MSSETSAVNVHGAWSAKRLTLLAMMLALISVSSYIAIPLPFSDAKITAQTMIVNLIGLLIAPQDTILVMASWLLLGLCGVPVFSGGSAGPGKLLGPSGGYYIGFLVVAFLISLFCRKWKNVAFQTAFLIVVGIPVIYAFGAGWMKHVTGQPWGAVIVQSIIPFIPLDIVKCVAAVALGLALKRTGLFGK